MDVIVVFKKKIRFYPFLPLHIRWPTMSEQFKLEPHLGKEHVGYLPTLGSLSNVSCLDLKPTIPSPRYDSKVYIHQLINHAQKMCEKKDTLIGSANLSFVSKLGEGRFGVIMKGTVKGGTNERLDKFFKPEEGGIKSKKKHVAIKQLRQHVLHEVEAIVGFMDEAQLLESINHPSIIRCLGVGTYETLREDLNLSQIPLKHASAVCARTFLVLEYAKGGTIGQMLLRQMQQPAYHLYSDLDAARWSRQIASGLAYLHGNSHLVIHRDLSSSNILLTSKNLKKANAKLADFGLHRVVNDGSTWLQGIGHSIDSSLDTNDFDSAQSSKVVQGGERSVRNCLQGHTYHLSGKTGNPLYMAPEVWLNQAYNEKVDIFALGCIMFELFTGQLRIFDNTTYNVSHDSIYLQAMEMSSGCRPRFPELVPDQIKELISQCWHQDQILRPSAKEVEERIQHFETELRQQQNSSQSFCQMQ
eukprot:TRINITY_DN7091_c0_g1_i1.p1 TRINITY_DN7091_c0_g1~~TRINITY_DN7091_c0_g1_i1.p1  ORF type:complete len:471 (-),score=35.67 TRINITY_DN7091_c0_g1_i1:2747-4159(-)